MAVPRWPTPELPDQVFLGETGLAGAFKDVGREQKTKATENRDEEWTRWTTMGAAAEIKPSAHRGWGNVMGGGEVLRHASEQVP